MCGRVRITKPSLAVSELYLAQLTSRQAEMFPPGEYSAGDAVRAISHAEHGGAEITMITWGLVVSWLPAGELLRHARAETVLRKPTFAKSARERRCVIPVDGWYERGTRPGVRRDYHPIAARDRSTVALAALWWPGAKPSDPRRLVIGTKEAQGAPARIHHRCPMVVAQHEVGMWVDPAFGIAWIREMFARPAKEEGAFEPLARAA